MAKAIMRSAKLASMGNVASSLKHNFRERETANADETKTPENEHLAARSTDEAMGKLRALLPENRRKDAVLAVEYVCTASPEWWKTATPKEQADFFKRSVEWIEDKYGKENLIVATIHRDEKSPHLSAYVVPKTQDGRLSAKEFIGNRAQMVADQTSFAQRVADLGLERGIEGSKAKHQTIKDFYAQVEQPVKVVQISPEAASPRLLKKNFLSSEYEGSDAVAKRLTGAVNAAYAPVVARAKVMESEARRAAEMAATAKEIQSELEATRRKFERHDEVMQILAKGGNAADMVLAEIRKQYEQRKEKKSPEKLKQQGGPTRG
jgi:hypothetical protein